MEEIEEKYKIISLENNNLGENLVAFISNELCNIDEIKNQYSDYFKNSGLIVNESRILYSGEIEKFLPINFKEIPIKLGKSISLIRNQLINECNYILLISFHEKDTYPNKGEIFTVKIENKDQKIIVIADTIFDNYGTATFLAAYENNKKQYIIIFEKDSSDEEWKIEQNFELNEFLKKIK